MTTQIQTLPRLDPHLVYWVDAAVSLAMGVTLFATAEPLTQLAGWAMPASFLSIVGLLLLPWAALNAFVARTAHPARSLVLGIILGDIAWVSGSALLLAVHATGLSPIGLVLLTGQGIAVAGVLALKLLGVRALA